MTLLLFLMVLGLLAQFDFPTVFGNNMTLVAVVIGFVMPPAIEAINRRTWPSEAKAISAFVLCIPGSLLAVYIIDQWHTASFDEWLRTFLIVFLVAIMMHRFYWKPSGMSDAIAADAAKPARWGPAGVAVAGRPAQASSRHLATGSGPLQLFGLPSRVLPVTMPVVARVTPSATEL